MDSYERLPERTSADLNAAADINQITENIGAVKDITDSLDARVDALEAFPYLYARDEKGNNTAGGGFTSGAWQVRQLNLLKINTIAGATLANNQVTLPPGKYRARGRAPGYQCGTHKLKLLNTSDTADVIIGANSLTASAGAYAQTDATFEDEFTIAEQKNVQLQHRCGTTKATDGFGVASNFSCIEIYAELWIWKVG